MPYDAALHHRRSIRLRYYDYRRAGAYFVTLCTHDRIPVFGAISGEAVRLSAYGEIVADDWAGLAALFARADLDAFVVMPNHLRGIVVIAEPDDPAGTRYTLGRVVGAFKTRSAKHVNERRETPGAPLWQRNYYEHIIRSEDELARIRDYIAANPARWAEDLEYVSTPAPPCPL